MQKGTHLFNPGQNRWWIYQRERFPILLHGLLIFVFSLAAVGYGHVATGHQGSPGAVAILVSFIGSFITFALLRIADEFKDYEDDARYRPYRAVPRGLVQLSELGMIGALLAALQLAVAFSFSAKLALLLLAVWVYFLLMSKEFFVPRWLKARPAVYLFSHMLIMPLIALYASAPGWIDNNEVPSGLSSLLILTFFIGMVGETGRKIRAPADEETGVETYSKLWGRGRALGLWLILLLSAGVFALQAADNIGSIWPLAIGLSILFPVALIYARRLMTSPKTRDSKTVELISGLWALIIYCGLAAITLGPGLKWS
jgi:4-hydroxybenzoate polyprenyltransferase